MLTMSFSRPSSLIRTCIGFTILLLTGSSIACGVLTHNEILRRSRYIFSQSSSDSFFGSNNYDPNAGLFYRHHAAYSKILSAEHVVSAEQAGAFFPDWGYGCFSNDIPSEAAHWPPWVSAAITHFYRKYGPMFITDKASTAGAEIQRNTVWPNGTTMTEDEQEHKEKLLAFIYAVTLHGSSDATWHSLKMVNGYIRMVAGLDFGASYGDAHSHVDTGGDFMLSHRMNGLPSESKAKDWVSATWWVPLDDIFEIYESMDITLNNLSFRFCLARGLAAIRAIVSAGGGLYDTYAERSPAMVDFLDEYYLGGLDEMAANAAWCWRNLTVWMVEGHDDGSEGWNMCDTFKLIKARDGGKIEPPDPPTGAAGSHHGGPYADLAARDKSFAKTIKTYEDAVLQDDKPFGVIEVYIPENIIASPQADTPTTTGTDKLYVLHPTPGPFPGSFLEPTYLRSMRPFSKFGSYLSIVDHLTGGFGVSSIDVLSVDAEKEGSIDLIVSAFTETDDQDYISGGAVYSIDIQDVIHRLDRSTLSVDKILAGSMTRLSNNDRSNIPIEARTGGSCHVDVSLNNQTATYNVLPPQSSPNHPNARFGATTTPVRLRSGIFNVVTTLGTQIYTDFSKEVGFIPSGKLEIFHGAMRVLSVEFKDLPFGDRVGEREFGVSILAADVDDDGDEELIIGAPYSDGYRPGCGVQLAEGEIIVVKVAMLIDQVYNGGCISGKMIHPMEAFQRVPLPLEEKRGKECNQDGYEWFGKTLVWLDDLKLVSIGAPGLGKLYFYKFDPSGRGGLIHMFSISGPEHQGFGGWGLESGKSKGGKMWVAVGVPNDGRQLGHLRVYNIITTTEAVLVAKVVPEEKEKFGKFGMVLKGDGKEGGLWVGSSWAGSEKGAVWWVDIDAVVDWDGRWEGGDDAGQVVMNDIEVKDDEGVREIEVKVLLWGSEEQAHFGASIALADIDGDGKTDLMVGIPYDGVSNPDQNARFMGAVAVFLRAD